MDIPFALLENNNNSFEFDPRFLTRWKMMQVFTQAIIICKYRKLRTSCSC